MQYNDAVDRFILRRWVFCALATSVTLVAYIGAVYGDFQFDDFSTILENPHLERWQTFVGHLDHMVRPALYATFLLDRSLYGTDPFGYHLLNLLLHLGSGLLVYLILNRAVTEETKHVPLWTALLFLIHPMATETVTYISGRASGLMTFLYLFAFFLYIRASEHSDAAKVRRLYLSGSILSLILSLGSKETAATFPLVLLLWDLLIRRLRGTSLRTAILSGHLPFWIVLFLAAIWASVHPRYSALAQFSSTLRPIWINLLSELHAIAYALVLFFTPWNQNFDHDVPLLHSLVEWPLPLDLVLLGGLAAAALVAIRPLPLFSFGVAWYVVQLLPTALIPRNDLLSERNLYLASAGILLAVVVLASGLTHRLSSTVPRPKLARIATGIIAASAILALSIATVQRNVLYRDPVLLWSDTAEKSPQKARPHNNLGHSYAEQGNWDQAIDEFRIAARLDQNDVRAQDNLRDVYLRHVGRR